MTRFWTPLTIVSLLSVLAFAPVEAQTKVATIDMKEVFDGYWKTENLKQRLEEDKTQATVQHQKLLDALKTKQTEYRGLRESIENPAISNKEKEKRNQEARSVLGQIQKLEQDVVNHQKSTEARIGETSLRYRRNIIKEIQEIVAVRAKTAGYNLVLDIAAEGFNGTPIVVFTDKSSDISQTVLAELNRNRPTTQK